MQQWFFLAELVSHEDVIRELEEDTISKGCGLGVGGGSPFKPGSFATLLTLEFKVATSPALFNFTCVQILSFAVLFC